MPDTRRFKIRATKEHTEKLLSWGRIEDPEKNYVDESGNWTSFEDAYVARLLSATGSYGELVDILHILAPDIFEKVYLDDPTSNQDTVISVGNTITNKFIMKAQAKHADDLISYGMTIPGEIFVYVPSPDKPIDDSNPLCFVSEDKASEFSSWPEGVSRECFDVVFKVCTQPSVTIETTKIVGELTMGSWSLCDPSLDKHEETSIKSLDKYLLDLQSDMLYLSEAIVAALECLREESEENNDSFVKAYNKYRSKRGQTVLGEE